MGGWRDGALAVLVGEGWGILGVRSLGCSGMQLRPLHGSLGDTGLGLVPTLQGNQDGASCLCLGVTCDWAARGHCP